MFLIFRIKGIKFSILLFWFWILFQNADCGAETKVASKGGSHASTSSVTDQPASTGPDADQPASGGPDADQPASGGPDADQPASGGPDADQPASAGPGADQPASAGPGADQPASAGPDTDQPASTGPGADQPASGGPDANRPANNIPDANRPTNNAEIVRKECKYKQDSDGCFDVTSCYDHKNTGKYEDFYIERLPTVETFQFNNVKVRKLGCVKISGTEYLPDKNYIEFNLRLVKSTLTDNGYGDINMLSAVSRDNERKLIFTTAVKDDLTASTVADDNKQLDCTKDIYSRLIFYYLKGTEPSYCNNFGKGAFSNFQAAAVGSMQIPISMASKDFFDASSSYSFSINSRASHIDFYITSKSDKELTNTNIEKKYLLSVYIYRNESKEGSVAEDPGFINDKATLDKVLAYANEIFRFANIKLELKKYEFVDDTEMITQIKTLDDEVETLTVLQRERLAKEGGLGIDGSINLFVMPDFSYKQDGSGVSGFVQSVPGPGFLRNGLSGGIVVMNYPMEYRGIKHVLDESLRIVAIETFQKTIARTIAHEIGHSVGLQHTSEYDGSYKGILTDIPRCTKDNDSNGDGILEVLECRANGSDSLMFWKANVNDNIVSNSKLSEGEKDYMRSSIIAIR